MFELKLSNQKLRKNIFYDCHGNEFNITKAFIVLFVKCNWASNENSNQSLILWYNPQYKNESIIWNKKLKFYFNLLKHPFRIKKWK